MCSVRSFAPVILTPFWQSDRLVAVAFLVRCSSVEAYTHYYRIDHVRFALIIGFITADVVNHSTYWMAGLAPDAAHFFKFLLILVLYTLALTLFVSIFVLHRAKILN